MTAEEHNRTLATLYLIYGAMHGLTLVALLLLILVFRLTVPDVATVSAWWLVAGIVILSALMMFVGVLPVVVGWGFRKRARWVRPAAQALAIVSLVNVPIGTALGIYTLKFFRTAGGVQLYGGQTPSVTEGDLEDAMRGAQSLVNLADRMK